ncbi:putative cysteine proteinase [Diaporthe ampelina]|uniref:Putative cysteine proteinase n=1 Tax=Diaporthe ampelina TaxID=1214573 RepID=A0A0G2FD23_9PEZI|nr:putative cysteine proteinase [Diaporthe ampelina]
MGKKNNYDGYSSSDCDSESSSTPSHRRSRREGRSHKTTPSSATRQLRANAQQDAAGGASEEKKKKPKVPPQETIDKIWEKFSQKKFSKALAVLPFSPVSASKSTERGNELLCAGYERAAEECWDIDWDFKWEKGHCLNSLGSTKFEISASSLADPAANIPKAVKRVHEIFKKPTFMENVLPGDIKQGNLGNCWLIASLTGLANVPDGIKRICVEYDTKIGIYGFVFHRDGEWIYSIIDDKLFLKSPCWDSPSMQRDLLKQIDREDVESVYRETYQTGSKALFFGQNKDQNETWVPLLEKAYAKAHGDYASLSGGWIGEALEDLSGGVTTEILASDIFDTDAFWEKEVSKVNQEFLFGCSTGLLDGGYGDRDGISEGHAYVIMEARTLKDGTRLCKLRNPWGKVKKGNWEGAWSDGSKEWTTEVKQELDHTFGSDSTFWISYDDLLRKYQHFDRTRLFRDPDWRSCQRWAGVEVPWKPQYNEKFHIKLTKESPLVLVLSQLDIRYFRGLQGQYNFRLQFRLHEEGSPGAEDYIVRSHGNYLMDRSVSVELPSMLPGKYVVFISVIGERDNDISSTEEVIKEECKGRTENEKLAQVGEAYDLAHSKAASHLKRLGEIRKKAEGKKASDSRRKERRKNWERRQAGRDVKAKQTKKNEAKKAKLKAEKKAKAEAEKKMAEEKARKDAAEKKASAEKEAAAKAAAVKAAEQRLAEQLKLLHAGAMEADTVSVASSSASSDTAQHTPQDSPRTESAQPVPSRQGKVEVPPATNTSVAAPTADTSKPAAAGGQAQAASGIKPMELKINCCSCSHGAKKTPEPAADSDGYSSDSPVEDYENLYDPDDTTSELFSASPTTPTSAKTNDSKSDDEDAGTPDPWNAIAVVGFRVYSKDKDLELRVIMEGGLLEQDGMGTLGEADLDNGVANAGGQRGKQEGGGGAKDHKTPDGTQGDNPAKSTIRDDGGDKKEANAEKQGDDSSVDGDRVAHYRTIIERKTSEYERVMEHEGEGGSGSVEGFKKV